MKLTVQGRVATLYQGDKAILRISTKNDELTAEVFDIKLIFDVEVSSLVDDTHQVETTGVISRGYEAAPGIHVQREIMPPFAEVE